MAPDETMETAVGLLRPALCFASLFEHDEIGGPGGI